LAALQTQIAKDVSEQLRLRLTSAEEERAAGGSTANSEAYQLYLKGRYFFNKRTGPDLRKSLDFYNSAIEKDPSYALAYAGLAETYGVITDYVEDMPPSKAFPLAQAAATRAIALDPSSAEAHTALAVAQIQSSWDWPAAEQEFRRAMELNSNYPNTHYFYALLLLTPQSRFQEAEAEMRRALELDPFSLAINANFGRMYISERQYDRAQTQLQKTLDLDPQFSPPHLFLRQLNEVQGKYDKAIEEWQKAPSTFAITPDRAAKIKRAVGTSGANGYWNAALQFDLEDAQQHYVHPFFIAGIYAQLGDKDHAFDWLEKAYLGHDWLLGFLNVDPLFDPLHSDPRFQEMLRRIGLSR
jgi:tetratricopeptide (TPR) repeat protein